NNSSVANSGGIYGQIGGVAVSSGVATKIHIGKSGLIHGEQHSIWLSNPAGAAPILIKSRTIAGKLHSIFPQLGDTTNVTNNGKLLGDVTATSANQMDVVTNNKTISGNVFLGAGNDTYKGSGTVSGSVSGEDGNDSISGGAAGDRFNGGNQNDTLKGNA